MTTSIVPDRPSEIVVDLHAIGHNLAFLRTLSNGGGRIVATLKANAYGFGLVRIAQFLESAGIDGIAVADIADALTLRSNGIRTDILVHSGNVPTPVLARLGFEHNLILTVHDWYSAEALASAGVAARVSVKFDSGLERLGVPAEEVEGLVERVLARTPLRVQGLYTHFHAPASDELDAYLDWQIGRVRALQERWRADVLPPLPLMAASTAVLRRRDDALFDAIDPGSALFGMDNGCAATTPWPTRSALAQVVTALVQVRNVSREEFLSQAPFLTEGVRRIGILPIGFRDGFDAAHAGHVLVRGRPAPVLGAASLEVTRIDLTSIDDANAGDPVVVIGRQQSAEIGLNAVLRRNPSLKGVGLRLMMSLGTSIARRYVYAPH